MSKKDSISRSLSQWRKTINILSPPSWRELLGPNHSIDLILASPLLRSGAPLREACEYFGLDQNRTMHQALLLRILAKVCFESRPRHRPKGTKKWGDVRYVVLARCFEAVAHKSKSGGDLESAKHIKEDFPDFRHMSCGAIRQRLPEARSRLKRLRDKKPEKPKYGLLRLD
jgi:hypothetical protein